MLNNRVVFSNAEGLWGGGGGWFSDIFTFHLEKPEWCRLISREISSPDTPG